MITTRSDKYVWDALLVDEFGKERRGEERRGESFALSEIYYIRAFVSVPEIERGMKGIDHGTMTKILS